MKNDERDAGTWPSFSGWAAWPEAWIPPPDTRELRELVRFRFKLSNLRTGIKAQAHAVMAKNGVLPCRNDMWVRQARPSSTPSSSPRPMSTASRSCETC